MANRRQDKKINKGKQQWYQPESQQQAMVPPLQETAAPGVTPQGGEVLAQVPPKKNKIYKKATSTPRQGQTNAGDWVLAQETPQTAQSNEEMALSQGFVPAVAVNTPQAQPQEWAIPVGIFQLEEPKPEPGWVKAAEQQSPPQPQEGWVQADEAPATPAKTVRGNKTDSAVKAPKPGQKPGNKKAKEEKPESKTAPSGQGLPAAEKKQPSEAEKAEAPAAAEKAETKKAKPETAAPAVEAAEDKNDSLVAAEAETPPEGKEETKESGAEAPAKDEPAAAEKLDEKEPHSEAGTPAVAENAPEEKRQAALAATTALRPATPEEIENAKNTKPLVAVAKGGSAGKGKQAATARKPKKKRRRRRTVAGIMIASVFKVLFVLGCMVLIALSIAAVHVSMYMAEATADDDTLLDLEAVRLRLNQTTYFMALNPDNENAEEDGDWVEYQELIGPEHRIWVSIDKIPDDLVNAVIAIEDREFENHHGVDIRRTAYAIANEFLGLEDRAFGASTIEQQLIKNLTGDKASDGESGYQRKMREIFRAWGLDTRYTKSMIMEAYLNTFSLSGTVAGVQAGAIEYFDKNVEDLSLQECAMIAGITRAPGAYDPFLNPKNCLARRNSVLEQMLEVGYITQAEYNAAVATPLGLARSQPSKQDDSQVYSYFSDQAFEEVVRDLMDQKGYTNEEATDYLFTGGLRVHLTVDMKVQQAMEQMYYNGYDDETGFFAQMRNASGRYFKDVLGIVEVAEDGTETLILPQSAAVIINYEGALQGVVGGIGPKTDSRVLNRATQSPRQVGSCMKPIAAYALGIENGLVDYSSMIVDSGVRFNSGTGSVNPETGEPNYNWPKNVTNTYRNTAMSVVQAICESTNTVAVKVGMRVGVEEMYDFLVNTLNLKHMVGEGPNNDLDFGPLVLGSLTYGITAYELAGAYMMFGNGGQYNSLHAYTSVYDAEGNLVMESKRTSVQAISEETAYVMNRLLNTVVFGTPGVYATASGFAPTGGNMDSIAKTGTTSNQNDRWIVGMTPYYVTAVWWGYDNNTNNKYSINWSTGRYNVHPKVWQTLMDELQEGLEYQDFPERPEGVVEATYCTSSGMLHQGGCPGGQTGYYTSWRVPEPCNVDHSAAPPEAA